HRYGSGAGHEKAGVRPPVCCTVVCCIAEFITEAYCRETPPPDPSPQPPPSRGGGEKARGRLYLLDVTVEHPFGPSLVERDIQTVVLDGGHHTIAELLVEHPAADRNRRVTRRAAGLLPGLDHLGAARQQRELRAEHGRRRQPRIARQRGGTAARHLGLGQLVEEP